MGVAMAGSVTMICSAPGFEANTVSIRDRWTGRDSDRLGDITESEPMLDFLRGKLTGCHIEVYDDAGNVSGAITDPADLTAEAALDLDEVVLSWLGSVLYSFIGSRRRLGNLSARVQSDSNVEALALTTMTNGKN